MNDEIRRRPSSVQNALRLLHLFSVEDPEMGISSIAAKMGIANSTAHRLVTTLASEGFIAKDRNTNLYRLGISILGLSNVVTGTMGIHQAALPTLHELAKQANESVMLAVFRSDEVIFINRVDTARSIRSLSIIGSRMPAYCTSSGQVFLAHQPKETVDRIVRKGLTPLTQHTITDPGKLYALLQKVRVQGYAISVQETQDDVTSVAAPIRDARGAVVATVSIPGPVQRMTNAALPQLVKLAILAADNISNQVRHLHQEETANAVLKAAPVSR